MLFMRTPFCVLKHRDELLVILCRAYAFNGGYELLDLWLERIFDFWNTKSIVMIIIIVGLKISIIIFLTLEL